MGLLGREWLAVGAAVILGSSAMIEFYGILVVLPLMARDYGFNSVDLTWIFNAQLVAFVGPLIAFGRLSYRVGPRRLAAMGVVVFGVSTALIAVVPDIWGIIALRAVQGIGSAMVFSTTLVLASRSVADEREATAVSIYVGGITAFGAAGPLIAGLILEFLPWQWFFYVDAGLAGLGLLGVLVLVRELETESDGMPFDTAGFFVLTAALVLVVAGVQMVENLGLASPWVIGSVLASVVLLFAFYRIEKTARSPLLDLSLLTNRDIVGTCLFRLACRFPYAAVLLILPLYIQYVLGYSAFENGLIFLSLMIANTLGSFAAEKVMNKLGVRLSLAAVVCMIALAFVCLGFIRFESATILIMLGLFLFGIGTGTMNSVTNVVGLRAVPKNQAAVAANLLSFASNLAPPLGVAVLMVLFRASENWHLGKMLELAGNRISDSDQASIYGVLSGSEQARQKLLDLAPSVSDRVQYVLNHAFEHAFRNVMFTSLAISVLGVLAVFLISTSKRRPTGAPDQPVP